MPTLGREESLNPSEIIQKEAIGRLTEQLLGEDPCITEVRLGSKIPFVRRYGVSRTKRYELPGRTGGTLGTEVEIFQGHIIQTNILGNKQRRRNHTVQLQFMSPGNLLGDDVSVLHVRYDPNRHAAIRIRSGDKEADTILPEEFMNLLHHVKEVGVAIERSR